MQVFCGNKRRFGGFRFAALAGLPLLLAGCGSINIPLGSLLSSSSSEPAAPPSIAASQDPAAPPVTTATLPPADNAAPETKLALAGKLPADGKPFTLEAPVETTGSIEKTEAGTHNESQGFGKEDRDAVLAVLKDALPEKGSANSQAWSNAATGNGGMVVPMARVGKQESGSCRDLLISYGKDAHKDWYRAEGCRTGGSWRLSDVTPWRKTR